MPIPNPLHALARPRAPLVLILCATLLAPNAGADDWNTCIETLQQRAAQERISSATWQSHAATLQPQPQLLAKLDAQPEFTLRSWDYLASLVDEQRIADGRAALQRDAQALAQAQARFGVDAATVTALWGVESNYGERTGAYPVIESLLTLSCMGRRQSFFRAELFSALRIVQAGDIAPQAFRGSWAGAFGQTQFMPSTFERLAVDLDGDGRRNLIDSRADALGSSANFLRQAGWDAQLPWGLEVKPLTPAPQAMGRRHKRAARDWEQLGVRAIDGRSLAAHGIAANTPLALLEPEAGGPMFLVTRNFDAVYRYNASENYALAIVHLADRLRGGSAWLTPWPTPDLGLSRAEKRELQTLLIARGHTIGELDGALGERSRAAITTEQVRLGHTASGRAGQLLLRALRDARSP